MTPGLKLVILDRDGTINEDRDDFVKSADEWVPLPGALEAIARLNHAGWHTVVATNQSGIGRGLFDMAALNAMHMKMNQALHKVGGRVDAVFFCPHTSQDDCACRKPRAGLFELIAERYGIELAGVPAVGDSMRDLRAGQAAGCRPHLVRTGKLAQAGEEAIAAACAEVPGTQVHADLAAFAEALVQQERAARGESGEPPSGYGHLE
jgi:D-glycero-D-manno-heptose 1,7-bisphosphate phosphatase